VSTHDGSVAIQKPTAYLAALPDINGNGYADVAVLLPEAATGKNSVYIKDGKTKRLLRTLTFLRHHIPLALAVLPDFDGNGLQEDPALAVLGHHPASGEVQVQIRSAVSGALLQTVLFPKLTPVALAGLPDVNANGAADVAVLLHNPTLDKSFVHVKDGKTGEELSTAVFLRDYTPLALAVLRDFDGKGEQEDPALAVLGYHPASGEVQVQIRSAVSGTLLQTVLFPKLTPVALAGLPDVNGNNTADVAVLLYDPILGKNSVYIKDGRTGEGLGMLAFLRNYTPLALTVIPDFDGNGQPENLALAVLGQHDSTAEVQVQIRQAVSGMVLQLLPLPHDQVPLGLAGVEGLNDKAGTELAVLSVAPDTGLFHVSVHDTANGLMVMELPFP
jgi:hypothetical protein